MQRKVSAASDEVARLRGERDSLRQQLELRMVKDEQEFHMIEETRTIANNRKVWFLSPFCLLP